MGATAHEYFDVVVVGAGLSGIGAGYRLQTMCPDKSYVILEAREAIGGTWDIFRYPGIRSDSDMFTLGYPFRPWKEERAIADGPSILRYVRETATEYGVDRHIRFNEKVVSAEWSSEDAEWLVTIAGSVGSEAGKLREYRARFLYLCSGYYSYESGHRPRFREQDRFAGEIVHPQQWPEDLDYNDKRVVVIGSGATAVTLVPAMAEDAAHVTMLQRSPSYIASIPARDPIAEKLGGFLPETLAHAVVRWKNVLMQVAFYQLCQRRPDAAKRLLRSGLRQHLPSSYPLDPDFAPRYQPWDQRMCLVPDADLFRAIRSGRASVVTDEIDCFTERGIRLRSGDEIEAEIIVSATGLRLVPFGDIRLSVDGEKVEPGSCFIYKAFMVSGVPNLALCFGYTNASWTLRADLSSRSVCRLLKHMDRVGAASATPVRATSEQETTEPLLGLTSGYVMRAAAALPKQGARRPWRMRQNYLLDLADARFGRLDEGLVLTKHSVVAPRSRVAAQ